jgi:hypothetical protein
MLACFWRLCIYFHSGGNTVTNVPATGIACGLPRNPLSSPPLSDAHTYSHARYVNFDIHHTYTHATRTHLLTRTRSHARTHALQDSCIGCTTQDPITQYTLMSNALNSTGKPVLFDMCWGTAADAAMKPPIANSWRIGPDDGNWHNIVENIDIDSQLAQCVARPTPPPPHLRRS